MIAQRLLSSIHLILCLGATCAAQAPYTIGHYLRDRTIGERIDSAYQASDVTLALTLHKTLRDRSPGTSFWRAQLVWAAGGSPDAELAEAFNRGFRYVPNVPPDSFETAHAKTLAALELRAAATRDIARIQRCEVLIERDQALQNGPTFDSLANRNNVDTLDVLISEGGWPSSYLLSGMGVAIVLAHQKWDKAHLFEPYQALIEQECIAGRENWTVALNTLQQRIRWTARGKTDTIRFDAITLRDHDRALPMIVAISERLAANGTKHVWIHAADPAIALAITERIILVQPKDHTPPDVLEFLQRRGFDHPARITTERITVVIDPHLPKDRFLYRMD